MQELLLNGNSCFSELTSNFPFFSDGSTWASLDIAASLFGTPSPSISSTIITVSHFPKVLAGNMSDLMLSPKYTTCRVSKRGDKLQTLNLNSSLSKSQGKMACVMAPRVNKTRHDKSAKVITTSLTITSLLSSTSGKIAGWGRIY